VRPPSVAQSVAQLPPKDAGWSRPAVCASRSWLDAGFEHQPVVAGLCSAAFEVREEVRAPEGVHLVQSGHQEGIRLNRGQPFVLRLLTEGIGLPEPLE
jgi:hypothetical protein